MKLLKDDTIFLSKAEREDFFAVYSPNVKDTDSQDRVEITDLEEASWVKFAFESKVDDAAGAQKRVWSRSAAVLGELCGRLQAKASVAMSGDMEVEAAGG